MTDAEIFRAGKMTRAFHDEAYSQEMLALRSAKRAEWLGRGKRLSEEMCADVVSDARHRDGKPCGCEVWTDDYTESETV
jgi:hypothetical protein